MGCNGIIQIPTEKTHRRSENPVGLGQNMPRILLADDQQEILRTVLSLLDDEYEVVGVAQDGEGVLELLRAESPDLLVLDIFMPVLNGIETAIRLRASGSAIKLLFLTVHEDADFVDAAISVGALGYVLKAHLITDLLPAIREVLKGNVYISPSLSCR
jgi:DNA-binding NarL/FixJ family response regulator